MESRSTIEVAGHTVSVTHLDKVLYPETGTRKFDVIEYYLHVADAMVPHMAGRPVTRKRWPDGVTATPFFEKNLPATAPEWIERRGLEHSERDLLYPVVRSAADLVWLGQQAALELHVPQWKFPTDTDPAARTDRADRRSDRLVIDLDPGPGVALSQCARIALMVHQTFDDMGLPNYPVTSGSKGIHIYAKLPAPVAPDSARTLARQLAEQLAAVMPDRVTASMARSARDRRVFIDWSQNSGSKTTLAPYSLRGLSHPWVAAPRTWDELEDNDIRQLLYSEVLERLSADGDLLADLDGAQPSSSPPTSASPSSPPKPPKDPEPVPQPPRATGVVDLSEYRSKRKRDRAPVVTTDQPDEPRPIAPDSVKDPRPMLATDEPIDKLGNDWAYEGKWDGYRIVLRWIDGRLRLTSRSGIDMTADFPELEIATARMGLMDVVLDGEVVAVDAQGRTNFGLLAGRNNAQEQFTLKYFVFDVLYLGGTSLLSKPWDQRRGIVEELAPLFAGTCIEVPPLLDGPGHVAAQESVDRGWEGIVAKRRDSTYQQGRRASTWLKHKNWNDVEAVVGGWRPGKGTRAHLIGSLILGLPEETGLRYIGRVGTGFTSRELEALRDELEPLRISRSPFTAKLDRPIENDAVWVLPKLVCDVRFMDWSAAGHLRHPSWRGIRRDKLPGDL